MRKLRSWLFLMTLLFSFSNNLLQAQEKNNSTSAIKDQKEIKGQTYIITDNSTVKDIQPYIDALDSSDMRNHRLLHKRYTIIFKTGLKVELFSASEISKSGLPINLSDYPESFDDTRQEPIFALGTDNFIIEYHIASAKHH